ncbi:MAG: RNA polymerase sigma factor, partial [Ardenticatenaceae bacterium]
MVEPTDAELMTRVAASDSEALEALYDRHASLALGLALRILGERSIAEEILQEAFWRVWQNAETFDPGRGKVLTWIFGIVRNLAIDELRKRGRRPPRAEPGEDNRLNHIAAEGAVAEQVGMR